ncbi:ThiF family adenylyltransferase [Microvirga lenta]|uniref:ThiF family adenylyltransferase n=1 Tax=Microvirga lenta TaxID=2881337 RepID=UPI001CFF8ED6|nr:ThiF family adenylyltransferase [Microvirga lenta]MCB5175927.1 ThiF family adenylyltransferase [Microvirga lenta]
MIWWLRDTARARSEQIALAQLDEQAGWLSGLTWNMGDNLQLKVEFDIAHDGEIFGLSMAYPTTFPDTPPMISPRDGERLSRHQYGAGGELCLEFRPDNWDSSITGSMMVESAYRLLSGERPVGDDGGTVPSAHQASIGRELRSETMRFVVAREAVDVLRVIPPEATLPIDAWERGGKSLWTASLASIGDEGAPLWAGTAPTPSGSFNAKGFVLRTSRDVERFRDKADGFADALPSEFPELAEQLPENPFTGFIVLGEGDRWIVLYLFPYKGKQAVLPYKMIVAPETVRRLPPGHDTLADKRVAIVGCGSVGSKIAAMLARSGVRRFTLVDDDVFFPANLIRNELDARAIGLHKAEGLTSRLEDIASDLDITKRRVALGQQESAGSTEWVMEDLAKADLLIDATADPRAFNLVAAIARRQCKPMVWCQVYSGGIGGLVARARPNLDPPPIQARAQIQAWCDSQSMPWTGSAEADYGAHSGSGAPLIADDADVSVIAAHAGRMALDILTRDHTIFPSSAYLIGLAAEWIFQAPFDTWPIDLRPDGAWGNPQEAASTEEIIDLMMTLFPKGGQE